MLSVDDSIQTALNALAAGDSLTIRGAQGEEWVATREALFSLKQMGLETLPVGCIALPRDEVIQESTLQSQDMTQKLTNVLTPDTLSLLTQWRSVLSDAPASVYLIGGIPRDILLWRPGDPLLDFKILDWDWCVEGSAKDLAEWLCEQSDVIEIDSEYEAFGTVKLQWDKALVEIASTRHDQYKGVAALPEVSHLGCPLAEDSKRRDFTVNTLVIPLNPTPYSEQWTVLDTVDGFQALEEETLTLLHGASLWEDPSRLLRAFKFATRFDFVLSPGTRQLAAVLLEHLPQSNYSGGGSRIREELMEWWQQPSTYTQWNALHDWLDWKGWRLIHPTVFDAIEWGTVRSRWNQWLSVSDALDESSVLPSLKTFGCSADSLRWLSLLLPIWQQANKEQQACLAEQLELTKIERDTLSRVPRSLQPLEELSQALFNQLVTTPSLALVLQLIAQADDSDALAKQLLTVASLKTKLADSKPISNGSDLQAVGFLPGPVLGQTITALHYAKWQGELLTSREAELDWVRQHSTLAD